MEETEYGVGVGEGETDETKAVIRPEARRFCKVSIREDGQRYTVNSLPVDENRVAPNAPVAQPQPQQIITRPAGP